MRWFRDQSGKRRLWIDDGEFDTFTEQELRQANLYPEADQPAVDIERFIQRHQGAGLDQYAELGKGLAGAIEFWPDHFKISISRSLTEQADEVDCEPGVRGRWRATMAHEAAHGLFHREIFQASPDQCSLAGLLFEESSNVQQSQEGQKSQEAYQSIQCLEQEVVFGGGLDWREFQANRGMASLLMPRTLFITVVREQVCEIARNQQPVLPQSREYRMLVSRLSHLFEVSQQAAIIRLREMDDTLCLAQSRLKGHSKISARSYG